MKIYEDVISINENATIQEIAKLIKEKKVRHVYIVDEENKLKGIIAALDIINKVISEGKDYKNIKANEIMNEVKFVNKEQDIAYAYAIMRNFNTLICPVVDEDDKLIGYYKFEEVAEELKKQIWN